MGRAEEPDWWRRYPPLLAIVVAAVIALAILPSSLTLPQARASETLQYAPVPPKAGDEPPPPGGDLSSLGLGRTSLIADDAARPEEVPSIIGRSPRTKDCVNTPLGPRQTEDPLSPPCVADFRGDNGGATYQGVGREEIRILVYVQGYTLFVNTCRDPNQKPPDKQYFDLAAAPEDGEHCLIRVLRNWQSWFNERYQTYDRFAHVFVYVSGEGRNAEERRADAAENYAKVKPFAVITNAGTFADAYLEVMTRRGVLNFGSFAARSERFFREFAPLVWGYLPTLEKQAENFASYLCTKVQPNPVSSSPDTALHGRPRRFALWRTTDETRPELIALAGALKHAVREQCGMTFAVEATFPSASYVQDNRYSPRYATTAVARFQQEGVTTVVWPGGVETNLSKEAARVGYLPEIIAWGDGKLESINTATFQDQRAWDGTHVVSNIVFVTDERTTHCYRAYKEAEPSADDQEARVVACPLYADFRQLFNGIQVAGPRLTPQSVDRGFHAIPAVRSTDSQVPACFYDPGDYTCVKDALVERWERDANGGQGCYRATEGGARYFAGVWPEGDVAAQEQPDDPCNAYDSGFTIEPNPPSDPSSF